MMGETPYEKLLSKQTDTDPEFAEALAKNRSSLYTSLAASQPIGDGMEVVAWAREVDINGPCLIDPAFVSKGAVDLFKYGNSGANKDARFVELVRLSSAQALIAAKDARIEELTRERDALQRRLDMHEAAISFVHRWTWEKEGNGTSDAERLSAIKHHPAIAILNPATETPK